MKAAARLLFPAIRWATERDDWSAPDPALAELGVGGWILFGGTAEAVAELTARLRAASPHPILIGADLERGAGQQFTGATPLPPAAALASLDDLDATRRAGALTGREAVAVGVDWVYAPVADVDVEPDNPIVGTRAFGTDPDAAAAQVAAWVQGCRSAGAMACAKHFPGHGRTTTDSHLGLPRVDADAATLEWEMTPFRTAIEAGVDAVMTAHVAYPALDSGGAPATLSRAILATLRNRLGFAGLVVTDALIMEGAKGQSGPGADDAAVAAVQAVAAGCDALLYPPDPVAAAEALERARGRTLPADRLDAAIGRVRAAAEARAESRVGADDGPAPASGIEAGAGTDAATRADPRVGRRADRSWALELAVRTVHAVRGEAVVGGSFELLTVDDDLGGPHPAPARSTFRATLTKAGRAVVPVDAPGGGPTVVAVYADIRGFKGRSGLSESAKSAVRRAVAAAPSCLVVLFGHPRLAEELPGENVLCAWGGEPLMQEAAAAALAGGSR
jgi:beta-glucosidase-like glycosyl hydrolase